MLHEKLIPENFIHHVQKDQSVSPEHTSKIKSDIYNSYSLQSEKQHQLRLEDYQVLDLSRRYESNNNNEIGSRKTPSPPTSSFQNDNMKKSIKTSPNSTTRENYDSSPPPAQSSVTATGKTLAASIQKLYAHHSIISSSTTPTNSSQTAHLSQGFPIYPLYYPQIKNERTLSPPQTQKHFVIKDEQLPTIFPQEYHNHANLIQSFNLMKAASIPEHIVTNLKSPPPQQINIISPKSSISPKPLLDDRLSETGSIPGSPSSSSLHYTKMKKSEQQHQQGKPTRPFKAYPRDPTVIAANFAATDSLYDNSKVERYSEYRKRILEQIRSANGGERTISNPKMRRTNNNRTANCSVRSDESNSDGQMNNSESGEDRTGDSDNDSMAATDTNLDNDKINNNDQILNKNDIGCGNGSNVKDAAYFERRRKNNAAAKKSRDRRRIKEDEIAIRAAYLERQNIELLCQLDALKSQLETITKNSNKSNWN